jgi:hypothetical protein
VIISLALVLLVTASGTLVSYVYDEDVNFAARVCAGACVGIAALGLVGFVFASFLGLTPLAILLTLIVIVAIALLPLATPQRRAFVQQDLSTTYQSIRLAVSDPRRIPIGYTLFYLVIAVVFWRAFQRAMIETPEGIFTGLLNNFGDLPFHLSVITSFSFGNNFPPEDPTYAGVRFTYPFLTDFVSAVFVRCGASLRESMFIENFVVAVAFVGVMHRWALVLLRDKLAAVITPILVLLNGGVGWILLWDQARASDSGVGLLQSLMPSYTVIPETTWRWGNALSTLLIPQRGFLLGLPLAVIVFTQWWLATDQPGEKGKGKKGEEEKKGKGERGRGKQRRGEQGKRVKGKGEALISVETQTFGASSKPLSHSPFPFSPFSPSNRRMIAAGIVAGLLPLVHAHSFVVVIVVGGCIAIAPHWRSWLAVIIGALPLIYVGYANYPLLPHLNQNIAAVAMAAAGALVAWILLPRNQRALWTWFFAVALIVALPQMWWSTHHSAVNAAKFFEWQFGWDRGRENALLFWLKNTGAFIPLTIAALLWRRDKQALVGRKLLVFSLPFALCFIVPNVIKLAPWIWDNIKVLFYWWLASAPLVALLLTRLWRQKGLNRVMAIVLFACVTLAGALDVASIVLRSNEYQIFSTPGVQFAEIIKREVPTKVVVIHAPVHNHPVFLTGRRSLLGYPGHVWTHGLEFAQRESEIKRVYAGAPDALAILKKYDVAYAVVGPLESNVMTVNNQFFSQFELVGEVSGYRLYKIK